MLAGLVVAQPVLVQAGQAGHLSLGKAVLLEERDDVAKVPFRACVENVLACADPVHNPAHLGDRQNHGALPVPFGRSPAGEVSYVSLSVRGLIRPPHEHGSH